MGTLGGPQLLTSLGSNGGLGYIQEPSPSSTKLRMIHLRHRHHNQELWRMMYSRTFMVVMVGDSHRW